MVFADECLGGVVEKARHEKNPLHSCWVRIYRILGSFAKVSICKLPNILILFLREIKEDTLLSTQSGNKVPITFLILSSVFTKRIMTAKLEMKIVSEITVLSQ